ncbi:hypothetical protein QJS10_CPA07g00226 [Acorus calamus]|uniref:Ribonuclease H1 N-terminal domain-containing protein n=1 Tax=Acorus calamus TaxID=4465 RepID=A0AAV9EGZ0_ACOCL|nr:hypothetical protein QJS10_CPA07g00226 [Acorus calamus]
MGFIRLLRASSRWSVACPVARFPSRGRPARLPRVGMGCHLRRSMGRGLRRWMGNYPFYTVAKGRRPGVYDNWAACHAQVHRFRGATLMGVNEIEERLGWSDKQVTFIL